MVDTARLRGLFAEKNLSQRKVAKGIGMPEATFRRKMKRGIFGTDDAEKIIVFVGIDNPAEIFLARK